MQAWQIKALELEASVLKSLDGIIADYGPYLFIGVVLLLITFGIWVLSGGLRRKLLKEGKPMPNTRPVIFIHLPGPPPTPPDMFDPFPPPHHSGYDDYRDDY